MGFFDAIKDAADSNEAAVEGALDQLGAIIDQKTGGQFTDQIDQAKDIVKSQVGDQAATPVEEGQA